MCFFFFFFLSVWTWVLGRLDETACSYSWEHVVQILKPVVSCVSDLLCYQHSTLARQLTCWYCCPSGQTGGFLRGSKYTIPCSFHSTLLLTTCRGDRPQEADLTGSSYAPFFFLGKDNRVSQCIKCKLMDIREGGILCLDTKINTAWCLAWMISGQSGYWTINRSVRSRGITKVLVKIMEKLHGSLWLREERKPGDIYSSLGWIIFIWLIHTKLIECLSWKEWSRKLLGLYMVGVFAI